MSDCQYFNCEKEAIEILDTRNGVRMYCGIHYEVRRRVFKI